MGAVGGVRAMTESAVEPLTSAQQAYEEWAVGRSYESLQLTGFLEGHHAAEAPLLARIEMLETVLEVVLPTVEEWAEEHLVAPVSSWGGLTEDVRDFLTEWEDNGG